MKKLPREYRLRAKRIARDRAARKARVAERELSLTRDPGAPLLVKAPSVFGVKDPGTRGELLVLLARLREEAVVRQRDVRIDFSKTTLMTAAGTLLLAAEISRINQLAGSRRISCRYPKDKIVAQVLQHVGVFEMVGQRRLCEITADNVKYWRVHSGTDVDGERAGEAILNYGNLFSKKEKAALFRGLVEAMTNTHHHAYEGERGDGLDNIHGWWMFLQLKDGRLSAVICDLGIGIPRSLRENRNGLLGEILSMIASRSWTQDDSDLIKAAIAVGKTRTHKGHRGKGLHDIRTVLDRLGGSMQIHSNRGSYLYDSTTKQETCSNYRKNMTIHGTLVLWQVPVPQAAPSEPQ